MIELRIMRGDTLRGYMVVLFHFFTLSVIANEKENGMHLTLGVGASKLEVTLGLSLWNRWLIP